ncbi:STAS domain-containing protein [uncultured Streptomyces sp.]|uniref:STAS domain-containing protein n=1 Tax=uncultured Streptomyces sp. TaxID=174707 RepID=UPI00261472FF|nr:STAS domain-containing protein [uncultured Streptomyces sp.]
MTTPLTLATRTLPDGRTLLEAVGEIDMSNSDALASALEATTGPLVIDLMAVEYLDSAGLSVLFGHAERLEILAGPLLAPVLTISGLAGLTTTRGA